VKAGKTNEPAIVRAVLLERAVPPYVTHRQVVLYGRGLWASTKRAEVKCWASGPGVEGSTPLVDAKLRTRSRTLADVRDPMLAQEWAFGIWDEYLADVAAALGAPS
jgi:hypothetical protein